jgi:copper chaperone NosL
MTGPPELRLGREECAECGMLVSEDRFSAAMLVDRNSETLYLFFDDVGCLLDYEHKQPGDVAVHERYAHDHGDRQWLVAEEAVYVLAGATVLPTPMGSGIAAFASREHAEATAAKLSGEVLDWPALRKARRKP